jgi:hypothetical protein
MVSRALPIAMNVQSHADLPFRHDVSAPDGEPGNLRVVVVSAAVRERIEQTAVRNARPPRLMSVRAPTRRQ